MPREIQFNNPAFRGVQAQQGTMYAPDEGEVFFTGGSNEKYGDRNFISSINYIKDGKAYTINPENYFYQSEGGQRMAKAPSIRNMFSGNDVPLASAGVNDPRQQQYIEQGLRQTLGSDADEFINFAKRGVGYLTSARNLEGQYYDFLKSKYNIQRPSTGGDAYRQGMEMLQKDFAKKGMALNPGSIAIYNPSDITSFGGIKFEQGGSLDDLYSTYTSRQQATGNIGAQTNIRGVGPGAATMDQAVANGTATNYDSALGADKIAQLQAQDKATQALAGTAPTAYNTAGTTSPVNLQPPQALKNAQGDTIFLSPSDASYQSYINAGYSATTPSQVPPGATYISDPKMLAGLTESQIWREPGTGRIYKLPTPLPSTTSLSSVTPGSTGGPITLTGASTGGTPPASTTPYDALNKFGGNLGATALNDIDKILMGFYQNQIGQTQSDLAKAKGEVDALKGEMTALKSSTYLEGRAKQLFESGRVEELFNALSSNRRRMENEMTSMNLGLQGLTDQPIAAEIIYGQKRTLQEQATARVGVIAASTEAMLGELDRAIQISDRVFSAIKEDRNTQIGALEKLLDLADKNKTNLLADEKDQINAQISILQDANDRMAKDKDAMQKLITDQPLIASAAGVSFTDTYDQALNKILTQAGNKNSEVYRLLNLVNKKAGSGGGAKQTTLTDDELMGYLKEIINEDGSKGYEVRSELIKDMVGAGSSQQVYQDAVNLARRLNSLPPDQLDQVKTPETSTGGILSGLQNALDAKRNEMFKGNSSTTANLELDKLEAASTITNAAKNVWNWLNESVQSKDVLK